MNKRRLVIANWKMYVESPQEAKQFASALRRRSRLFSGVDVVIAPSFPLIPAVAGALKGSPIKTGAQNVSVFGTGSFDSAQDKAHTGDVSAAMLKHAGTQYVIVGHSELRALGESNEHVAAKLALVANAGLVAVLCVGERERDAGGSHFSFITEQLSSALKNFPKAQVKKLVVAYEPVWAIGKSAADAMKPADLREMGIFIKKTLAEQFDRAQALKVPILYGGSVEQGNARALIVEADVNGFLVGHASAQLDSFIAILRECK